MVFQIGRARARFASLAKWPLTEYTKGNDNAYTHGHELYADGSVQAFDLRRRPLLPAIDPVAGEPTYIPALGELPGLLSAVENLLKCHQQAYPRVCGPIIEYPIMRG